MQPQRVNGAILDNNENIIAKINVESRTLNDATLTVIGEVKGELEIGKTVNVILFDPVNGLVNYIGVVSEFLEGGRISVSRFHRMRTEQDRREDIKVIVNRPVFIVQTDGEDGEKEGLRKFSVRLRDISAGGVCVVSEIELNRTKLYEMVFDLGREPDVISLRILRHTKNENGENVYGCAFVQLGALQESRIREYVFKKQLGLIGRIRA